MSRLTWSVPDGGRSPVNAVVCALRSRGHGEAYVAECVGKACLEFKDRAEDD